jgi:hypothetical protein
MFTSSAIAAEVGGQSSLTLITLLPAALHSSTERLTFGISGSINKKILANLSVCIWKLPGTFSCEFEMTSFDVLISMF